MRQLCTHTACCAPWLWDCARHLTSLGSSFPCGVGGPVCARPAFWAHCCLGWECTEPCCCWGLLEELLAVTPLPASPPHPEAEVRSGLGSVRTLTKAAWGWEPGRGCGAALIRPGSCEGGLRSR